MSTADLYLYLRDRFLSFTSTCINRGYSAQLRGTPNTGSHDLVQGEDTCTAWAVFEQHLVSIPWQARPDPDYAETAEIV